MSGQDDDREVVFFGPDGSVISREEMAAQHARQQMASDAFGRDMRRILYEELDDDQLATIQHLFRGLGMSSGKSLIAQVNWWEGLTDGAVHARKLARGMTLSPTRGCHPYTPDQEDPETFWACFAEFDGVVCGKGRDDQAHTPWNEGGGLE